MKKHLLLSLFSAFLIVFGSSNVGFGQVTTIDFETANDGYTATGAYGSGFTDLFNRTNSNLTPTTNEDGYYWGVEDLNSGTRRIDIDQIDVTGSASFTFAIDLLAHHFEDWDNTDELLITYSVDNGAYQDLMWVQMVPSDNFNGPAALDLAFDGDGDCGATTTLPSLTTGTQHGCTVSSSNFATFTTNAISLGGNTTLDIRIEAIGLTSGDEGIYFDNIVITEQAGSSDTEVNFTSATSTVTEDGISVQICAGITNESATATTVTLNLTGGTATNNSDFFSNAGLTNAFPASQTLTFPSNSSADQCVTVYIEDDAAIEGDQTVTFSLTGASGGSSASVGSTDTHTLTIEDDDNCFSGTTTLPYNGISGSAEFSHSTSSPPASGAQDICGDNFVLSYTTAPSTDTGGNFFGTQTQPGNGLASTDWGGEASFQTYIIDVSSVSSVDIEGFGNTQGSNGFNGTGEFLQWWYTLDGGGQINIGTPFTGTGSLATALSALDVTGVNELVVGFTFNMNGGSDGIQDMDVTVVETPSTPSVELSANLSSGTEDATTVVTLTATADFAVTGDQTVDLTVTGTGITAGDYTLGATSITILDGQTTGSTTFTVVDDAVTESTETATVTIDNPSAGVTIGATDAVDIDITDNDAPVITTSVGFLSGFSTVVGTPSAEQTFTISGDNLTGNIFLGSVGGFQYSFDNSTYLSTLNIPVSGGDVTGEPLTIYVRLTGASVGSFSGNATVSGGGASSVDVALDGTVTPAPCQELFISEYHEDGGEKYIEIYNPTSSSINLSTYELRLYTNGSTSPSSDGLSGSIPAYSTLVYRNSGSSAYGGSSTTSSAVNFNGNDAVALAKSGTNIDVIGTIGNSSTFAADVVLRRNATSQSPNTSYTSGEWTSGSTVDVTDLGQHTSDCFVPNPEATLDINVTTGTEVGTTQIILTVSTDVVVTGAQTVDITLTGTADENDFTGANFSSPITVTIPNNDDEVTLTFNVNNDSDVEGAETATFTIGNPSSGVNIGAPSSQNLDITDDDNLTSNESVILEQGGEAASISSIINGTITNNTQGTQVWQFNLYDGNGSVDDADDKPTIYEQFTIRQSGGNTVPEWDAAIDNVKFFLGASATPIPGSFLVSPSTISFTPTTPITVADGTTPAEMSMRLTLDAVLPVGSDGQNFGFSLDASDVTVETDVLVASQLGSFTETSDASLNEIGVTATLQFIDAPSTVSVGSTFSITVSAIDANGNVDSDNSAAITLTQTSGSGTLSGTGTQNLVNGTYTFTGLSHDTEEIIQITASSGSFSSINANVNVVDEPYQLFDDFNRPNNNTVGVPSSETSATYTETGTGNGSRSRIQDNQLLLANCNNGASSGGNNGMEQVIFNVQNRFETTYDDAAGTLTWVFNMNQNRTNPSGFGSNTYAAGVILGSTQSDVESASASGYAVIIGNSGDPDPVKLVRFAGGLNNNSNVTDVAVSNQTNDENHFSVRVELNPCDGEWSLRVRDDGGSFADPNTGFLASAVTATDQTHTGEDLRYFGYIWQHGTSCTETATFDNVNIPNATTVSTSAKIWNGSVSSTWNVANNWGPCPGAPTITDDVEIANVATQPIISSTVPAAECDNLLVEVGATLTITGSGEITVDGNVTNDGTVYINNGGNFFQTENGTAAHGGSGNFEVTRNGNSSAGFNGWSTPVIGGILPGSDGYRYNSLAGTNSNADDNNPDPDPGWIAHSGAMTPGRGYYAYSGGTATFVGKANNGSYAPTITSSSQPLSSTSAPTFFNLIGNPYPSSLDADAFIFDNNSRIDGALYFWSDENAGSTAYSSDDYATYSTGGSVVPLTGGGSSGVPNGSIPSCQGFFVNCDASGAINFNNGQRGGNNSQFFKAPEEKQRLWLSINNDALELFNQTLVGFSEDATDQKDWGVDAYKLRGNQAISIGAQQDGETYVIATYESIPQSGKTVPLMTYVETAGVYTFVADSMEGLQDYNVYLQDLNDGILYPLEQGDSYSFNMTSNDEFGRFHLWFSPTLITGIQDAEAIGDIYYNQDNTLIVKSSQATNTNGTLQVIDMSGRVVLSDQLQLSNGVGASQVSNLANGVYAVSFNSSDGELRVSKKIVLGQY